MSWLLRASSSNPEYYFGFPGQEGPIKLPVVYLRFGLLPTNELGQYAPSKNHLTGRQELGISVYPAYYHQEKDMYILPAGDEQFLSTQMGVSERVVLVVSGTDIGVGGDGEPVLDPRTVKVLKVISPRKVVNEQDKWLTIDGEELPEDKIPWLPGEQESLQAEKDRHNLLRDQQAKRQQQERQEMVDHFRNAIETNPDYFRQNPEVLESMYRLYPELKG